MAADERTVREQKRACALVALGVAFPVAMSIARAELEREGRLVEALANLVCASRHYTPNSLAVSDADAAVRAYESEFAPKQRTVEQIARDIVAAHPALAGGDAFVMVRAELLDELAAALGKDGK